MTGLERFFVCSDSAGVGPGLATALGSSAGGVDTAVLTSTTGTAVVVSSGGVAVASVYGAVASVVDNFLANALAALLEVLAVICGESTASVSLVTISFTAAFVGLAVRVVSTGTTGASSSLATALEALEDDVAFVEAVLDCKLSDFNSIKSVTKVEYNLVNSTY